MTQAKILAFAGSARKESWNRKVLNVAVQGAREAGAEVTMVNLGDYPMPIYDGDWHEANGVPENIIGPKPNQLVCEHQSLTISCPYLYTWNGQRFEFVTAGEFLNDCHQCRTQKARAGFVRTTQELDPLRRRHIVGHDLRSVYLHHRADALATFARSKIRVE